MLDFSGPDSERILAGYRPEQSVCAHQGSAITVLEVAFKGGRKWRLPRQIRDNDYTYDSSEGTVCDSMTSPTQFTGKERDAETGLDFFDAR
jgi:hypothetical protein